MNAKPAGYLHWLPELGYGFNDAPPIHYGSDYWQEFRARDVSAMGDLLTSARCHFVRGFWPGELVDIGIGGGKFCESADAYGFDVNSDAIDWLEENGRYRNPYTTPVEAVTCWDSLEHIPDPAALLACVRKWLFVSIPIFKNADHCLQSRHYKPGEHIWYFTEEGFLLWCAEQRFELIAKTDIESRLGRDGIMTFSFRRSHG